MVVVSAQSPHGAATLQVRCQYRDTLYCNYDGSFMIARYTAFTDNPDLPDEVAGGDYSFIAKGSLLPDKQRLGIVLNGVWKTDNRYKDQFLDVQLGEYETPMSRADIVHYLSCGIVRGIGRSTAEKIYDCFGMRSLEILENNPERLLSVKGIGVDRLERIVASYKEANSLKAITRFLSPYRVSMTSIVKVYMELGEKAAELLEQDPFVLDGINGFDFEAIDIMARRTGSAMDSYLRMKSAARAVLTANNREGGHLFLTKANFLNGIVKLLTSGVPCSVLSVDKIKESVNRMVKEKVLYYHKDRIYSWEDYEHEDQAARDVVRVQGAKMNPVIPLRLEALITEAERFFDIKLSPKQREAVQQVFYNPLYLVTGCPGTGKTLTIKIIIYIQRRLSQLEDCVVTVAPTGRAASRMSETTDLLAQTLHKALHLYPINGETEEALNCVNKAAMVIVDECSMVDMRVFYELMRNIRDGTRLVLMGDPEQLPSVGAGNVLKELLECRALNFTVLDVIFRQDEMSTILSNILKIREGDTSLDYNDDDFMLLPAKDEKEANKVILSVYEEEARENGINNVQVLTPRKWHCTCCSEVLNKELQDVVNPHRQDLPRLQIGARTLRVGDKVIQTRNTEDVCNGDIGYLNYIHHTGDRSTTTADIQFESYRTPFSYNLEECSDLELAYCLSVHKAQGSQFLTVIIPVLWAQRGMLRRNLLYTAISRARVKIILVGSESAIIEAIKNNRDTKRNSMLGQRINWYATCLAKSA